MCGSGALSALLGERDNGGWLFLECWSVVAYVNADAFMTRAHRQPYSSTVEDAVQRHLRELTG